LATEAADSIRDNNNKNRDLYKVDIKHRNHLIFISYDKTQRKIEINLQATYVI